VPDKYSRLTEVLQGTPRGQDTVEFGFDEVGELVGGLPPSAGVRQWWANDSKVQAQAWRAAGFHVEQVYLDRRRVRFACGERGGGHGQRARRSVSPVFSQAGGAAVRAPVGEPVDVRVCLQWLDGGPVTLDAGGKPTFAALDDVPGVYRMTLTGGVAGTQPRVYIGETDSLRRRLSGNYRSPGSRQRTSLRVNALLCEHLTAGGTVALAVTTTATLMLAGAEQPLDLTRKAGRLLAENAALVLAQVRGDAEIVNLG